MSRRATAPIPEPGAPPLVVFPTGGTEGEVGEPLLTLDSIRDRPGRVEERETASEWPGMTYKVPVVLPDRDEVERLRIGAMYVTVGGIDGYPLEVFTTIGKAGGDASLLSDCISRLVSGWLQTGEAPYRVVKHLMGMRGSSMVRWLTAQTFVLSVPDGIGKAIVRWMHQHPVVEPVVEPEEVEVEPGPEVEVEPGPKPGADHVQVMPAQGTSEVGEGAVEGSCGGYYPDGLDGASGTDAASEPADRGEVVPSAKQEPLP